jgi:hypothetical protein
MALMDELKTLLQSPEAQAALKELQDEAIAEAKKPPQFYVHLANGDVVTLEPPESESSHHNGVQIIARYQVGN